MNGFPFVLPNKIWMYDPQNRLSHRDTAPPQGVYRQPHDFLEKKIAARFLLDPGSRKSYINSIFTLGGDHGYFINNNIKNLKRRATCGQRKSFWYSDCA
jgi:hypothetical protein